MRRKLSVFLLALIFTFSFPTPIHAGVEWTGNCIGDKGSEFEGVATIAGFECLLANVFRVAITLIGIAIVFMILFAGFRFLTSGGDPKGVAAARQTITYAILGLILAISGWFILFLISQITGNTQILEFEILQGNGVTPIGN